MKPFSFFMLGNMNNYPFLLADALVKLGHNVRFLFNRSEPLHNPLTLNLYQGNSSWITDVSTLPEEDYLVLAESVKNIARLANKSDIAILNDCTIGLAGLLPCRHVALTTGSDITYFANYSLVDIRTKVWDQQDKRTSSGQKHIRAYVDSVTRQREGLVNSLVCTTMNRGSAPDADLILDNIGVLGNHRMALPFSNVDRLKYFHPQSKKKLIILSGSRVMFSDSKHAGSTMLDVKGSEILLLGFSKFINNGGDAELRLPDKGHDVGRAKSMLTDLGLVEKVRWLPQQSLLRFYEEIREADIVCDQFGSSIPAMLVWDSLALGRPVVGNLRRDVFDEVYSEPIPGFNCVTADDVAKAFETLSFLSVRQELALRGRSFAEKNYSATILAKRLLERF